MPSSPLLAVVADLYTPLLGLYYLHSASRAEQGSKRILIYLLVFNLAIAWGGMLADRAGHIWPSWSLDYSTHTAVALALVISLSLSRPAQSVYWVASMLAYAGLMIMLGYHSAADIMTTALATGVLMFAASMRYYRILRSAGFAQKRE